MARTQDNPELEAWALYSTAMITDDPARARAALLRVRLLATEIDARPILRASIDEGLARVVLDEGEYVVARQIAQDLADSDDRVTWMTGLSSLACASLALGDRPAARAALARNLVDGCPASCEHTFRISV